MSPRPRSQVTPRTVWTVGLNLVALVLLLGLLREVGRVLSWVLVALFLALAVNPLVSWLQRHRVRRELGVLLVFGVGLAVAATLLVNFVPRVMEQVRALLFNLPDMVARLEQQEWVGWLNERINVSARINSLLREELLGVTAPVLDLLTDVLLWLAALVTVVVLAAFFLAYGPQLYEQGLKWVRPEQREHWRTLSRRMLRSVGGYVAGAFFISFIGGGVTMVTLALLGVPYFLPLGLLMALLGLIPFLGAALGGLLVVGTTFLTVGTREGVIALVVFLAYQQLENNLLQPLIQKRTLKMSPLLIALAMLVGTAWAGVIGALLALPVAGAAQVLAQDALRRRQARWRLVSPPPEAPALPPRPEPPPSEEGPEARH